jgi:peptide subunit release factor 1 (eRF1)
MTAYQDALGQGLAVHGIPAVTAALAQGNVERLLLAADRPADLELWAARNDERLVGSAPDELGSHADSAFQADAGLLMLRAATATGAEFSEMLPDLTADDGCAAILRFAQ